MGRRRGRVDRRVPHRSDARSRRADPVAGVGGDRGYGVSGEGRHALGLVLLRRRRIILRRGADGPGLARLRTDHFWYRVRTRLLHPRIEILPATLAQSNGERDVSIGASEPPTTAACGLALR